MDSYESFHNPRPEPTSADRYYNELDRLKDPREEIQPRDVLSLLKLQMAMLQEQTSEETDRLEALRGVFYSWSHGNRVPALMYVFREAFDGNRQDVDGNRHHYEAYIQDNKNYRKDYEAYEADAPVWARCADGLCREPLCDPDTAQLLQIIMNSERGKDPVFYDLVRAALAWNNARCREVSNNEYVDCLYQYQVCRHKFFGREVLKEKDSLP